MKDIKLTIEEIKKIFECFKVEGYLYEKDNDMLQLPNGIRYYIGGGIDLRFIFDLREYKNILYRDFLQRVIEGINRKAELNSMDYIIDIGSKSITIGQCHERGKLQTIFFSDTPIDQAKTQAIKYILDKL